MKRRAVHVSKGRVPRGSIRPDRTTTARTPASVRQSTLRLEFRIEVTR